jgi:alpha-L-fucosidase
MKAAAEQHAALGMAGRKNLQHTLHPEAQWFPRAGLGLFIHWGIASVHGDLDLSWSMIANTRYDSAAQGRNKVTPEEYWRLAERFNPTHTNPDKWLAAAKAAGFQYAVFTAMHHDGYTLWPSAYGAMGVQQSLPNRDFVGPFVEACRKHGLKVGLYYSPPDWYFDRQYMSFNYRSDGQSRDAGRPTFDTQHQPGVLPPRPPEHIARQREIFHGRVEELLTRYGRIDLLWFDGGAHDNEIRDRARQLQPHIVINDRSCDGDFAHTECYLPDEPSDGWLETCHCWQHSDLQTPDGAHIDFWGYLKEEQYKPAAWMLESLVRLRSLGGNFLANVGPRPNGQLPDVVYERFGEVAAWMQHSRASVIGANPAPPSLGCNVPLTVAGETKYLHALPGFSGALELHPASRPDSVTLLRTGEALPFHFQNGVLHIEIPPAARTSLVDVVAVR